MKVDIPREVKIQEQGVPLGSSQRRDVAPQRPKGRQGGGFATAEAMIKDADTSSP